MPTDSRMQYERIADRAQFAVTLQDDGYAIVCTVSADQYGWPAPSPVIAVRGLPDEATAEAILSQMRLQDIAGMAAGLLKFQPPPPSEKAVEEPAVKRR